MSETESLNGFKKKLGSTCEFLCQWLLNMIIWVKYVAEKFKNFLIIKLDNNRCAKKKKGNYSLNVTYVVLLETD